MKLFLAASSLAIGVIGVAKSAIESVPTVNTEQAIELLEDRETSNSLELLVKKDDGSVKLYRVENDEKKEG